MPPLRHGLAIAALVCLGPSVLGYTIVRKNGTRMKVRDEPFYQDGTAYFLLLNGLFGFMPEEDVDRARTQQANASRSRREGRSRKAAPPAPPRVYTNDDLASAQGPGGAEGGAAAKGKEGKEPPATTEAASRTAPPPGAPAGPSSPTAASP